MSGQSFACSPAQPPSYRATRIEGEEELARIAREHGLWYSLGQRIERYASDDPRSPDRWRIESVPVRGAYFVEQLHPWGAPVPGGFELLSPEAFAARYRPLLHLAARSLTRGRMAA